VEQGRGGRGLLLGLLVRTLRHTRLDLATSMWRVSAGKAMTMSSRVTEYFFLASASCSGNSSAANRASRRQDLRPKLRILLFARDASAYWER
jgi:hypothetical protein